MIDFTIKTLESINHQFSVEDETTVAQLKEQIRDEMGIEIGMQRLIFCGRVLTDDQRLADFGVNGKVIHLVPRPPPSPQSRVSSHNPRQEMREAIEEAQRVIDRMTTQPTARQEPARQSWSQQDPPSALVADQQLALSMSPVASRLDFIRQILDNIRNTLLLLAQLQNGEDNDVSSEPMDYESSQGSAEQLSNQSSVSSETPSPNHHPGQESVGEGSASARVTQEFRYSSRPLRPQQPFLTSPRDLANLIEELEALREQFAPHHNAYIAILRDTNTQGLSGEETSRRRTMMELCCDVMHSVSHAYHAASDIEVAFGSVTRLTSGFAVNRHPITGQVSNPPISVLHAGRPIIGQGANRPGPLPSFTAFRQRLNAAANSGSATTGAPDPNTGTSGQNQAPGRNPANPESVTYQVEIETRVPIALPIDADFLGSLASAADQARQRHEQAQAQPRPQAQGQAQTQNATQPNQGQGQGQEQAQAQARPRFVMDIENLLRTLSQAHPGVEVVMSMEEIHPIGNMGGGAPDFNAMFGNRNPAGGINIGTITSQSMLSGLGIAFDAAHPGLNTSENTGTNTGANNGANTGTNPGPNAGANTGTFAGADHSDFAAPGVPMAIFNTEPNPSEGVSVSIGGIRVGGHRYGVHHVGSNVPPPVGAEGSVPVHAFGPSTITVQPDGSLFIAPVATANSTASGPATEMLHSLFPTMFRPVNVTTDAANAAPNNAAGPNTASNNSGNAANAAPSASNPVPSFTPASNANQNNTARPAGGFWTMSANAANAAPSASNPVPSFTPASNTNQNISQTNTTRPVGGLWTMSANAANAAPSASNPVPSFTPASNANQNTSQTNTTRPVGGLWTMSANADNAAPSASNTVPSFTPASNANQNTSQTNTTRPVGGLWTMSANAANAAPSASNPVPSFTPASNANQNTTQNNTTRQAGGLSTISANATSNNSGNAANAASASNAVPSFTPASNANQNTTPRAGIISMRGERTRNQQQVNSRIHELAISCMVYDRFLDCDSMHARLRVQEYRNAYQELYSEQVRRRSTHRSSPSIYHMEQRNSEFTTRHMAIMMRLLSGPACPEARLNAFMVTVARMLFLSATRGVRYNEPMCMPREFVSVRVHMREYIMRLIETVFHNDGARHLFEGITNLIISQHQPFLDRMHEITPINPEINPVVRLREFVRSRIPMIIACAISRSTSDTFVGRFFSVFLRFYVDLCTMVQEFCVNGFEGLRALYTAFFDQITENYEQTACEWLRLVARVILDELQGEIDPFYFDYILRGCRAPVATSTPPPPPPRNDTPETLESLPSTSIPTMSSASSTSYSPQYDDEQSISPVLGGSVADTSSNNSVPRSPVETRSACTSPRRDTPQSGNDLPTHSAQPTHSGQPTQSAQPAQIAVPVASASFALGQNVLGQHTLIALPNQSDTPTQIGPLAQSGQTLLNFLGAHNAQAAQTGHSSSSFQGQSGQAASGQGSGSQSGQAGQSGPGLSMSTGALSGQSGQSGQNGEAQGTRRSAPKSAPSTAPSTPPPTPPSVRLHWDEQWSPVFSRDHRLQRERDRPQEPFSDAYLCGMPSRKRRCVRNSRPPTTLDGFMNETVREATDRAASLDTTQIRTCLLDSVRSILRTRSDTSDDYDPVRFSATARFLGDTKPNTPEPDSKPDEKAEGKKAEGKAEEKME